MYINSIIEEFNIGFKKLDLPFHKEPKFNIFLLKQFLPEGKLREFDEHIKCLLNKEVDIDIEFMGFINDYYDIARMINRHSFNAKGCVYTVFDIGACHAFQHLFFQNAIKYYAVDPIYKNTDYIPKFFTNNCEYITGKFEETLDILKPLVNSQSVGIANMSLIYTGSEQEIKLFNTMFRRKFIW